MSPLTDADSLCGSHHNIEGYNTGEGTGYSVKYDTVWFAHAAPPGSARLPEGNGDDDATPVTTSLAEFGGIVVVKPQGTYKNEYLFLDGLKINKVTLPEEDRVDYVWGRVGNSAVPMTALRTTAGKWYSVGTYPGNEPNSMQRLFSISRTRTFPDFVGIMDEESFQLERLCMHTVLHVGLSEGDEDDGGDENNDLPEQARTYIWWDGLMPTLYFKTVVWLTGNVSMAAPAAGGRSKPTSTSKSKSTSKSRPRTGRSRTSRTARATPSQKRTRTSAPKKKTKAR